MAAACWAASLLGIQAKGALTGIVVEWGRQTIPWLQPGTRLTAIAAGTAHNLAVKSDGTVLAWGDNSEGQITLPTGLSNVVAVAAGWYHSLALRSNGTI